LAGGDGTGDGVSLVPDIQVPVCWAFVVDLNALVAMFFELVDEGGAVGEDEEVINVRDEYQSSFGGRAVVVGAIVGGMIAQVGNAQDPY
jgi:hypothetical protein